MQVAILAIGKMKGDTASLYAEYLKRITWKVTAQEFDLKDSSPAQLQTKESAALLAAVPKNARLVVLDATGTQLSSTDFAKKLAGWQLDSQPVAFLIGGADGHTKELLNKADFTLSLGKMTWPHRLARLMLAEQLYRAQQILAGHPYHRE